MHHNIVGLNVYEGLGLRVWGLRQPQRLGFRDWGSGFGVVVWGLEVWVWVWVWGLGFERTLNPQTPNPR